MTAEHITQDGQTAVPEDVPDNLNARSDEVDDVKTETNGSVKIYPKTARVADVAGMLKTKIKLTIEEMDEKVADAFRRGEL